MSEFHLTTRVGNLSASVEFYRWLFGIDPKAVFEGSYATFLVPELNLNYVMIQSDALSTDEKKIHHIGISVDGPQAIIDLQRRAQTDGIIVSDAAKTTWRGTAMHQLWLEDPDGLKIEIYSRLTEDELKDAPEDLEPVLLVH